MRLARSIEHLDAIPRDRLVADLAHPERPWSYGSDFAGRWIEVLSIVSRLPGCCDREFGVDRAVESLCRFQRADGMLGSRQDSTGWACAGRGLMGLVEAYATFGWKDALNASTRLVEHFDRQFPRRPTQRACWAIKDLVRYAEVSGDERGLRIARRMYDDCYELGPDCPFEQVFGNLTMFINIHRGLVALHRHTGQEDVLHEGVALRNWIADKLQWVSGGVPEWLDPPDRSDESVAGNEDTLFFDDQFMRVPLLARLRNETCQVGDWIMLNLELALTTGDDTYLETAEHAFWNDFLAAQADNGGWCSRRDLAGMAGDIWDFCCSLHGPRCLIDAMLHAVTRRDDGLRLNLHMPVDVGFEWNNSIARVAVSFDPSLDEYTITFGENTRGEFPLRLRQPPWAEGIEVEADGKRIGDHESGDLVVFGSWACGDMIRCTYRPQITIHNDATPPFERIAVQRGPLLLAGVCPDIDETDGFAVTQTEDEKTRTIEVDLANRVVSLVGLFWVEADLVDWANPDRGLTFRFFADGKLLAGSVEDPTQGWFPSQVIGVMLENCRKLVIQIGSTHPDFPVSAGHFTSMRLFATDGRTAVLDSIPEDGVAKLHDWRISADVCRETLMRNHAGRSVCPDTAKGLQLVPMKDLPVAAREEGRIGHEMPIQHDDFAVLLFPVPDPSLSPLSQLPG